MQSPNAPNTDRPAGPLQPAFVDGTSPGVRARGYGIDPAKPGTLVDLDRSAGQAAETVAPPAVSVILPVYNESGLIGHTFAAVAEFAGAHPEYEFLFVDDGSADETPRTLRDRIARARESGVCNVQLVAYRPNQGKGHAVKVGVEHARGGFVLFTDGDLAYSLDHLPRLVARLESKDVVIGSRALVHRSERNTTVLRRITGWTFNRMARVILGLPHKDTQAGLKGFRADAARKIFSMEHLGGFAFDVELVYIARRLKMSVGEIPAYVSEEHSYKISKVNLVRDSVRMFWALIDIRQSAWRGRYGR